MNRLKREVIYTTFLFILSVVMVGIGYVINYMVFTLFGFTLFGAMIVYSIYLKKQIKIQKDENKRRRSS